VVIAKPQKRFNERDKYIIDQYIMNGGKVIWFVEWMQFDMDSLNTNPTAMALMNDINLSDQLFNYGVRINPDLIQDLRCLQIPVCVNTVEGKPQFEPKPWYYFPLIVPDTLLDHQLVKNLDVMRTCFVSSIDTVGEDPMVKKTILLRTSQYAKALSHPVEISLDILREKPEMLTFNKPNMPVAVLLEGQFKSNFANRLPPELADNKDFKFKERSEKTQMIVVSDGDFIRNEIKRMGDKVQPYPLGYDKYYDAQYTPGNTQFIINCVNYLCADEGLISLRMRELKSRTLNATKVREEKAMWICVNIIVPILIVLLIGFTMIVMRKVKYSKKEK
jgi:ABC-2 type transport system permease protein